MTREFSTNLEGNMQGDQKKKIQTVEDCLQLIQHVSVCDSARCDVHGCIRMKRVLRHAVECRRKGQCSICKQYVRLCVLHAKNCRATNCNVHYCDKIRAKIAHKEQEKQRRAASAETLLQMQYSLGTSNVALSSNINRPAFQITKLNNQLGISQETNCFQRSLSVHIPSSTNTFINKPFCRANSYAIALDGGSPKISSPTQGLVTVVRGQQEMPLLYNCKELERRCEKMDISKP
eukprot:Seg5347.2 transcript_id=Seg5347.2/GoldUCD/mRNA.D3Y31 product="CREB-binding protein" protein_id=Seg5347.2/GoldUCD/D3Y31